MAAGDGRAPERPVVGVGVVVRRFGAVLLVRRARQPRLGEWSIPGGRQELGETVFEAAIREVAEETGVAIRPARILTVVDSITRDAAGAIAFHYTLVEIAADWVAGDPVAASDAAAARWADPAEAMRLVAWEETRRVIRLAVGQP